MTVFLDYRVEGTEEQGGRQSVAHQLHQFRQVEGGGRGVEVRQK